MTEACNNGKLGIKTKFKIKKKQNSPSTPVINSTHRTQNISKNSLIQKPILSLKNGKIKDIDISLVFRHQSIGHYLGMEFLIQFKYPL